MKFWNYIGEFFLFRWLLGKLHKTEKGVSNSNNRQQFMSDCVEDNDTTVLRSNSCHYGQSYRNSYDSNDYGWNDQSFDDFHEEQDDYNMMDDF